MSRKNLLPKMKTSDIVVELASRAGRHGHYVEQDFARETLLALELDERIPPRDLGK